MLLRSQVGTTGAGQDDRRCDDTSQHSESMLESKQKRQNNRHLVIETKEGTRATRALHERQVGAEEEGIVIVADQAMAGGEGDTEGVETLRDGLARGLLRHNRLGAVILVHFG